VIVATQELHKTGVFSRINFIDIFLFSLQLRNVKSRLVLHIDIVYLRTNICCMILLGLILIKY